MRSSFDPRAASALGVPASMERRRRDDPEPDHPVLLECDQRRPDGDATRIVPRAVDRVDDPTPVAGAADAELLAEHRRRRDVRGRAVHGSPSRPPGRPRSPGSGRASSRRGDRRRGSDRGRSHRPRRRARGQGQGRGSSEPRPYYPTGYLEEATSRNFGFATVIASGVDHAIRLRAPAGTGCAHARGTTNGPGRGATSLRCPPSRASRGCATVCLVRPLDLVACGTLDRLPGDEWAAVEDALRSDSGDQAAAGGHARRERGARSRRRRARSPCRTRSRSPPGTDPAPASSRVLDRLAVVHDHHLDRHDGPIEASVRPAALRQVDWPVGCGADYRRVARHRHRHRDAGGGRREPWPSRCLRVLARLRSRARRPP